MSIYTDIYRNSPVCIQNLLCSSIGYWIKRHRFSKIFFHYLDWLEETEYWPQEQIRNYQFNKLKELIDHCYNTVPYYTTLFNKLKLKHDDFKHIEDLCKIPILTKADVRNSPDSFLSNHFRNNKLLKNSTSGTTGAGMTFYRQPETIAFQWAIWWRFRKRFGINFDDRHANFAGKIIVPITSSKPPFWRANTPLNQTYFSSFHLSRENAVHYVKQLNTGKYKYYSGYPSSLSILAQIILENDLEITNPPKIIFTGSETLFDHQRNMISKAFKCPVVDQYGAAEHICNISSCPDGNYHEDFEMGIIEYEPIDIENSNHTTEIIATGLIDKAMPLIRYRIGDVAILDNTTCRCKRSSRCVKKILGRSEDYIITKDGKRIGRLAHVFTGLSNVYESQICQISLDTLRVLVNKSSCYGKSDEEYFRNKIINIVGNEFKIVFDYVDKIPREKNGKIRAVKSLI